MVSPGSSESTKSPVEGCDTAGALVITWSSSFPSVEFFSTVSSFTSNGEAVILVSSKFGLVSRSVQRTNSVCLV